MSRPLQKDTANAMQMRSGVVKKVLGTSYLIADGTSLSIACRATGCLLEPVADDLVLLSINSMGKTTILTVLERNTNEPANISVDGDVIIASKNGSLSLDCSQSLNIASQEIQLNAVKGTMRVVHFSFAGNTVTACMGKLQFVCETMESTASRVVERVNRLYRRVKNEDSRIGRLFCRVKGRLTIRAKETSICAEQRMHLNGDKIEIG